MGKTDTKELCEELVVQTSPTANGVTWYTSKICKAEFGMSQVGPAASKAFTCKLPEGNRKCVHVAYMCGCRSKDEGCPLARQAAVCLSPAMLTVGMTWFAFYESACR